jgi:hypothetical protein
MRAFAVAAFATCVAFVAAIPVTEPVSAQSEAGYYDYSDPQFAKRAATQVIEQCTVSGQIALTFDGKHCFPLPPLTRH